MTRTAKLALILIVLALAFAALPAVALFLAH